jgi:hypothetical protein
MNNNQINSCAEPTASTDVATKNYVDTTCVASISAGNNITITGTTNPTVALRSTLNTQIDMGGLKIINCAEPANPQDVATKNYVDTTATGVYQPLLTTSPFALPSGVLTKDGQQAFFINSNGDGGNEMSTLSTPNFTITCMTYVSSTTSVVVGGYNNIQLRAEVRCGPTITAVVEQIPTPPSVPNFTYIAFPGASGYVNVLYQSPYISNKIAVGGNFQATTSNTYDGTNLFPSNVSNFLVISSSTSTITPDNMKDSTATEPQFLGSEIYGVNGVVNCISSFSNISNLVPQYSGGAGYVFGGSFSSFLGAVNQTVYNIAIRSTSSFIFSNPFPAPTFQTAWYYFGNANGAVSVIFNNPGDDTIVVGGAFTNISGLNRSYLVFTNGTIPGLYSYINGFVPPSPVSGGCEAYITSSSSFPAYFGLEGGTGSPPQYPVYTMDVNNMAIVPSVFKSDLPAVPLGFGVDKTASPITLNFVSGYNSGNVNNYVYDFDTPHSVSLNGATNITSIYFDYITVSPSKTPYFFRSGSLSTSSPYECYYYVDTSAGIIITTNPTTLPFVDATQPLNKYSKITLATYNNFALGTLVGYGTTNDVRLLFYSTNGATFSNT